MFAVLTGGMAGDNRRWRDEFRATLALSVPIVLTNLAQTALTIADVMLTGRLGPEALAAGALGTNLYFIALIFGIGVVTATSPMIANTLGRSRNAVRDVRLTFRQGLWVIALLTIPVWAILWHGEELLLLFGQKPSIAKEAGHYLHALQWAYLPALIYVLMRSFVATLERPGWALIISILALPINVFIAWGLMFGKFGMPLLGLQGAGYATCAASLFMAGGMFVVVTAQKDIRRFRIFARFWRFDWQRFRAIWRLGLPVGVTMLFESVVFSIAALMMGIIGTEELAAHVIALQISYLCFMVPVGIGQAVSIRVGLANGAGDHHGVTRAGATALAVTLGFAAITATTMTFAPQMLISFYLDLSDPVNAGVIAFATSFLFWAAAFQFSDGTQVVACSMLRGLRDTRIPMLIAGVGYILIGLPLGMALAFLTPLRGNGIWIGLTTALTLVAVAMLWRWSLRGRLNMRGLGAAKAS